jgi:phosphoribosylanthranilate isomerase
VIRVKICGITRLEDALTAAEAGAAMLGYNFYEKSARSLSFQACRTIQNGLEAAGVEILTVGVFVNASTRTILETLAACRLDLAQLSGDEAPDQLIQLGERAFKGLRPRSLAEANDLAQALPHREAPPACLIDAYQPGEYGGTGKTGDWKMAQVLAVAMPVLLAGGLHPGNVAAAVAAVHPWGVDVASGVEERPGIKDPVKIREFIQEATRDSQTPGGRD